MKVLIIRFSSIGDIVLTTPVVRCLKQQAPTTQIHYLTKASFKTIVENNPYIDRCHYLEEDFDGLMESLGKERFDYIIDLHHNLRTLRVRRALKVKAFVFPKLNFRKWLLTVFKINILPHLHIVDRYMETVKSFGITNDGKGLDYFIPDKDKVPLEDIPFSHRAGYIGIVIGAALNTKKLPLHKFQELCAEIEHPIILLGGPEDKAQGDLIAAVDPIKIYNSCGKFNLNESAFLVKGAKRIITHDTGLMHIAAAFHKPILSVWGNTVPAFGMGTYYGSKAPQESQQFEVLHLGCRPCSKIGYNKCPRKHFKCMEWQNISAIAEAAQAR